MKKQILFLLVSLSIFACSNTDNLNQQANNFEETPEVLDNNKKKKSDLGFSSYNKRINTNIIDQLFQEAIGKNEDLKSVVSRIDEIKNIKKDSLEQYQKYIDNNQNYWNSLNQYVNQLNDSLIRNELKDMIDILKNKHTKTISPLTSLLEQIETSEKILHDQEILMKILVTEPMMHTYQKNEYPDINKLSSVSSSFDSLNIDIKPYTVIKK